DPADDPAGDAHQRDRLAARLRPVLHHDGGPALQPDVDRRLLHLPQLVPVPASRVRGRALADPRGDHSGLHDRPADPDAAEPDMTAVTMGRPLARAWSRVWPGPNPYLVAPPCLPTS